MGQQRLEGLLEEDLRARILRLRSASLIVPVLFSALLGCSDGTRPLLMIQLCVNDDQGVADFMRAMRSIASSEHLTFVDGGAETQKDLKTVGSKFQKLEISGSVLNFGFDRGDNTIVMGGNLGLPQYQIAIGFSGSDDPKENGTYLSPLR